MSEAPAVSAELCPALNWTLGLEELRSQGLSCSARASAEPQCAGAYLEYSTEVVRCVWHENATETHHRCTRGEACSPPPDTRPIS